MKIYIPGCNFRLYTPSPEQEEEEDERNITTYVGPILTRYEPNDPQLYVLEAQCVVIKDIDRFTIEKMWFDGGSVFIEVDVERIDEEFDQWVGSGCRWTDEVDTSLDW